MSRLARGLCSRRSACRGGPRPSCVCLAGHGGFRAGISLLWGKWQVTGWVSPIRHVPRVLYQYNGALWTVSPIVPSYHHGLPRLLHWGEFQYRRDSRGERLVEVEVLSVVLPWAMSIFVKKEDLVHGNCKKKSRIFDLSEAKWRRRACPATKRPIDISCLL